MKRPHCLEIPRKLESNQGSSRRPELRLRISKRPKSHPLEAPGTLNSWEGRGWGAKRKQSARTLRGLRACSIRWAPCWLNILPSDNPVRIRRTLQPCRTFRPQWPKTPPRRHSRFLFLHSPSLIYLKILIRFVELRWLQSRP